MNATEFANWLAKHKAAFGGLAEWIKTHVESLEAWKDCLSDVPYDAACDATRRLNRGEEDPPRAFGDHARAVRRMALDLRHEATERQRRERQYIDGESVVACADCLDTGWVIVANIWRTNHGGAPLKAFLSGDSAAVPQCAIACRCNAADRREQNHYDSERMFRVDHRDDEATTAAEFRRWWSEGRHIGREQAFDRFNAGEF